MLTWCALSTGSVVEPPAAASVPEDGDPLGVAALGLAAADADEVETLCAGLERADHCGSHAQHVPGCELDNLVVAWRDRYRHDDMDLFLLAMSVAERHAGTRLVGEAADAGSPLDPGDLWRRTIKPLMEEAVAPWAAFHTLSHTYAFLQLSRGVNVVQLFRPLGHHSPSFKLDTDVHLLEGEEAPALDLGEVMRSPGNITRSGVRHDLAHVGGV